MSKKSSDSETEFPGLYGSELSFRSDSDYGDSSGERSKKELIRGRKKDRNKDKGYAALDGDSSAEDMDTSETNSRNSSKSKKPKSFKFLQKKEEKEDRKRKEKRKEEKKREKEEKRRLKKKKKDGLGDEVLPVFGVPLPLAIQRNPSHDGIHLPAVVRQCIDAIEERGLECEEIYRLRGLKSKANVLRRAYDHGQEVSLDKHHPHVIATLLKQFLKELPEPILTREMIAHFEDVSLIPNPTSRSISLSQLVNRLPTPNKLLLQYMLQHMVNIIRKEKENKMSVQSICIILSPVLQISHRVLNVMFLSQEYLLKDVRIEKYVPPLTGQEDAIENLTTIKEISDEIQRQESLLAFLHSAVASGSASCRKEEQLWESQMIVTLLKRKLKSAKQKQTDCLDRSQSDSVGHSSEESTKDISEEVVSVDKKSVEIPMLPKPVSAKAIRTSHEESHPKDDAGKEEPPKVHNELRQAESKAWMDQVLPKISIELTSNDDIDVIKNELMRTKLFNEELLTLNHGLTKRLQQEKSDITRLREEIREMQTLYAYRTHSYDSSESDGSESAGESDTEEEICKQISEYQQSQLQLKSRNKEISQKIQMEREHVIELIVALRHAKALQMVAKETTVF